MCYGRKRSAAVVACRTRPRALASGPHMQAVRRIEPRETASAGTDRDRLDRWDQHEVARHHAGFGSLWAAVDDDTDVECGAAHVSGDDIWFAYEAPQFL